MKQNKWTRIGAVLGFLAMASGAYAQAAYTNVDWSPLQTAISSAAGSGVSPGMWVFIGLAAIGVTIAFFRRFVRR